MKLDAYRSRRDASRAPSPLPPPVSGAHVFIETEDGPKEVGTVSGVAFEPIIPGARWLPPIIVNPLDDGESGDLTRRYPEARRGDVVAVEGPLGARVWTGSGPGRGVLELRGGTTIFTFDGEGWLEVAGRSVSGSAFVEPGAAASFEGDPPALLGAEDRFTDADSDVRPGGIYRVAEVRGTIDGIYVGVGDRIAIRGLSPEDPPPCPSCGGSGRVEVTFGFEDCGDCAGTGSAP